MNAKINKETLHGEWVHSSEEDTPDEAVFRPADYNFPLTRRPRETIELKPDGKLVKGVATAADSVEEAEGNWELSDNNKIAFNTESEPHQTLEIASINKDKLVIKNKFWLKALEIRHIVGKTQFMKEGKQMPKQNKFKEFYSF